MSVLAQVLYLWVWKWMDGESIWWRLLLLFALTCFFSLFFLLHRFTDMFQLTKISLKNSFNSVKKMWQTQNYYKRLKITNMYCFTPLLWCTAESSKLFFLWKLKILYKTSFERGRKRSKNESLSIRKGCDCLQKQWKLC